jgi:hypothetical protein
MRQDCKYFNSIRQVPAYRMKYIVTPITKSTNAMTNAERLEVWQTLFKARKHLILPVLNRRLPCINYTK